MLKLRLSWFFFIFFGLFFGLTYVVPTIELDRASFALLSVNSFLYGFYITPILTAQKNRIEELSKAVRAEASALFDVLIRTKRLPEKSRNRIQDLTAEYLAASYRQRRPGEGEHEYEHLITYCLEYNGKDPATIEKILDKLVANQTNRSQLSMQLSNRVFTNEWWIMLVLFTVTLGFVLSLQVPGGLAGQAVKALLCTGISMLMINLLKFSTLTHKKAKDIWKPLDTLNTSRFRRFD